MRYIPKTMALFLSVFVALSGCAPTVVNRGSLPDPEKLAEIKVGESTREDVSTKLGTPTQTGLFDEKVWYYYGRTTEQVAFFDPKVVKQDAIEITFDDEGIVQSLHKLNPATDDLAPSARRTPTYGHETTFFEQMLGNLGRKLPSKK